jgi:hypothetical protein
VIAGGSITPNAIDTSAGAAHVQVHVQATDEQSGTALVFVKFTSSHGQQVYGSASLETGSGTPRTGRGQLR